jgi:hypothetical protein
VLSLRLVLSLSQLGDFDCPYLPFSCDVTDSGDRRVLSLPPPDDSASSDPLVVTERLIQRDDHEMFYSYSRTVPPELGLPYTGLMSKFAFVTVNTASSSGGGGSVQVSARGERKCCLQWTTSVLPNDPTKPMIAAEAVAKFQESWKPYFDAAIQMEE